jgi:hypothetical protein
VRQRAACERGKSRGPATAGEEMGGGDEGNPAWGAAPAMAMREYAGNACCVY